VDAPNLERWAKNMSFASGVVAPERKLERVPEFVSRALRPSLRLCTQSNLTTLPFEVGFRAITVEVRFQTTRSTFQYRSRNKLSAFECMRWLKSD
jgi:hypothetical protein